MGATLHRYAVHCTLRDGNRVA